ncbi:MULTISPECIES: glycerate kinase type-2 family protein [Dethiosulfovibrio]|uniref:Glycerate kinase n=2 Tax=Dethiosulfovibrio TaxID=47054 RepID=A0ABS9EKS9_9BACT|nr:MULTISPECIES: glycerate kinase [Dethiosulfovibrio]MCF4113770.1 glycerate kinase [Dethiosulfovibrio russensis]MCF4141817.1 glycerate kinase [Dethiosulfovibrio marinus]MCF4143765.1 glycerate kinase [Dethiosulfovibrio acidaminovorans]
MGKTKKLREDCLEIIRYSLEKNLPDRSTRETLQSMDLKGPIVCLAVGKAAWTMAKATSEVLGDRISRGLIVTKYGHSGGDVAGMSIIESGHPVPDGKSLEAGKAALDLVHSTTKKDRLLVLLSGGGSSLMEFPLEGVSLRDMAEITDSLLSSGAPIEEINKIRKRLSQVKAGRLALAASPSSITNLILSDVLGNDLGSVASGPTVPDDGTAEEAMEVALKYGIRLSRAAKEALKTETPKVLDKVETIVLGDVYRLCTSAAEKANQLGYETEILAEDLNCEARQAGSFLAAIARKRGRDNPRALILGGETVVHLKGEGKGGRNQELVLSAAVGMDEVENAVVASVGSDGTDGPTDAAGGMVDGDSISRMRASGIDPIALLEDNDSYRALKASEDLIITGPTGTNVNDLILLLKR